MKLNKIILVCTFPLLLLLGGCQLEQMPEDRLSKEEVFSSEDGLELYAMSFHDVFPSARNFHRSDAALNDLGARTSADNFLKEGAYNADIAGGWSWSQLRNINYFLESNINESVQEKTRNEYNGMARLARAQFYYDKVIRFGDVPWIDRVFTTDDEALMAPRDSRVLVFEKILEDLNYAIAHLPASKSSDGSTFTKWTALALKARVCLFEGTFRKYHTELNLQGTANAFLQEAIDASSEIMESGLYKLYDAEGVEGSYRALFVSDEAKTEEVIYAVLSSQQLGVLHDANWWWTSGTYGVRFSFIKQFINIFLNRDGTSFTDLPDFNTKVFFDEMQGRDARLSQIIRTPGYERPGVGASPPNFNGYTYTGYQPIKFVMDDPNIDDRDLNTNALPLFRYAEVLLIYAEAKAELGTITDEDWANTIGLLRKRAGITKGTNTLPTKVDAYLKETFYPDITSPVLLEIRRERMIELVLEGQRFHDLIRWKLGESLTRRWVGMYVPSINTPMDLDRDGKDDVLFYQGSTPSAMPGVALVNVSEGQAQQLTNGTSGHLTWADREKRTWYSDDRQYYYPIPQTAINKNNNLKQNPGW